MYGKKKRKKGYADGGYVAADKDQMPLTGKPKAEKAKMGAMFPASPARPA